MTPETSLLIHLKLLLLVGIANGAPLLGPKLLRERFNRPLDAGAHFLDGRPLLGRSKTIRGILLALIITPLAAVALGISAYTGLVIALLAMLGDLCSSFIKRRMGLPASGQAIGLDQIPESLFPLLAIRGSYALAMSEIAAMVAAFVILELLLSRVLFKFRLRDQPY